MATNAGKILVTPKGDYNPATEYKILDTVRYSGKTWVCKQICTGQTPAISVYWDIWCEDGIDGIDGIDGADGTNTYTYIRYSASADGTGFVGTPTSLTIYIGFYAGTSATAPADKTAYTWSKYVGESGSATSVTITDTNNYFTSDNVEGALSEVGNTVENIEEELVNINTEVALKADKSEVTNVMTPKGNIAYASLPTTENTVGWYYYCSDGDGVNGAGNYVWNGTAWYFGGTGDEGYNKLSVITDDIRIALNYTKIYGKNKLNPDTIKTSTTFTAVGAEYSQVGFSASDYIAVSDGDTIYMCGIGASDNYLYGTGTMLKTVLFDSNENVLSVVTDTNAYNINNASVAYIRFSYNTSGAFSTAKIVSLTLNYLPTTIAEIEAYSTVPVQAIYDVTDEVARTNSTNALEKAGNQVVDVIVPPFIPFVASAGHEINVYYENLIKGGSFNALQSIWLQRPVAAGFTGWNDKMNITHTSALNLENKKIIWRDAMHEYSKSVVFIGTVPKASGEVKMLTIGDSKVDQNIITQTLNTLFTADGVTLTQLGIRGVSPANHEGRSSWSTFEYCNNSTYATLSNAFWNPSTSKFDFSYYMAQQGYTSVDVVNLNFGTNDVRYILDGLYTETDVIARYTEIVNSIHSYDSNIKICIGLTESECLLQTNDCIATNRNKDMMLAHVKALIDTFGGRTTEKIFLAPLYINMDLYEDYNMTTVPLSARDTVKTKQIPTDRVHQSTVGYRKNADIMYATIQYALSL